MSDPTSRHLAGPVSAAERETPLPQPQSTQGLWWLCLFLALSLAALKTGALLPRWATGLRPFQIPLGWIHVALAGYACSALLLTLSRVAEGGESRQAPLHVAYLGAFYGFYGVAGSLGDHFPAVFVAGLAIFGVDVGWSWWRNQRRIPEVGGRLG